MTRVVLASPVPAIAAVDGVCVGGALEFAASCDLRLCTNRVRLITPEVGIGLVASNAGTLLLPEVVGETAARELLLSGEERDAALGARARLRDRVRRPGRPRRADRPLGRSLLAQLAGRGRGDQVDAQRSASAPCCRQAMDRETHHCVRLFDEPDARAALRAFAEARG